MKKDNTPDEEYMTAEELNGYFNTPEDDGNFVLDLEEARNERAEAIFAKRANEIRNPLSGEELFNETVKLLKELRAEELERKLNIYKNATDQIATLGHIDILGQYEKAFSDVLKIASNAYVESGDSEEDQS